MKPLVLVIWWWWWGTIETQIFAMMKEIWQLISAKKNTLTIPGHGPAGTVRYTQLLFSTDFCSLATCDVWYSEASLSWVELLHFVHLHIIFTTAPRLIQGSATKYHYYESLFTAAPLVQRNKRSAKEQRTNLPASNRNFSPPKMNFDALSSSERDGCFWCWRFGALCFLFLVQKVKGSWSQFTTVEKSFPSSDFKEANIFTSVIVTFVFYIYDHTTK